MRNRIETKELENLRLIARPYDEQADKISAQLKTAGVEQKAGDHIASEQDLLSLLEANLGTAIMPETSSRSSNLRGIEVDGFSLRREVSLYAVAGRERPAAATGLMRLLRSADWSTMMPFEHVAEKA